MPHITKPTQIILTPLVDQVDAKAPAVLARDFDMVPTFIRDDDRNSRRHVLTFTVEVGGARSAAELPNYRYLLQASGLEEKMDGDYERKLTEVERLDATIGFYHDGEAYELRNVAVELHAADFVEHNPVFRFRVEGDLTDLADGLRFNPDYSGYSAPVAAAL